MESYTQSYTRKCQPAKDFSVSGVGNVVFFQKNFFWKRDSSLFLHHIPGESVCREILAYVSLCPESLFPGDASSACRRKPLNRRWETLIHGDTPCASKVCLRIVDTNMKNAYHQSTYFIKVAPGYSSFLWNIIPVPKSNTHLFLSMKSEDNMPDKGIRSFPFASFKPSIMYWQLLMT